MTDLMSRRGLLRGLFAMPAVILTPKLLMPIKAFLPAMPLTFGPRLDEMLWEPGDNTPKFFRWIVKVETEHGGLGFTLTDDAEQAATEAAAAAAAFPGAEITSRQIEGRHVTRRYTIGDDRDTEVVVGWESVDGGGDRPA